MRRACKQSPMLPENTQLYGSIEKNQQPVLLNKKMEELEIPDISHRRVGTLQLAVIVFYMVAGGPFGIEEAVRSGGALYAILGFAIMPLIWSIPEALVTAELGAAYPEASGTVAWVEEAFGPAAGWLQGCLTWTSGATDNAIYPVLFLDYALQIFGHNDDSEGLDSWTRFLILGGASIVLTYINYRGLNVVGDMSITVCVLSMSPFVVLCIVSLFKIEPTRWLQRPDSTIIITTDDDTGPGILPGITFGGILWRPFLNNLFWNLNSFDATASLAGEVSDPGQSLPRAMLGGSILVILGYLLPLMAALGATDSTQSDWVDGYMATVASNVVGPWLGVWVVFAAGISNLALFEGEMSSDAFQIMGMAERGYLPKIFAKRSRYGTPTAGLIMGLTVILVMSLTDISALIEMLNLNYSLSLILEYAAFVKLRIAKPNLDRPYRIPLSTVGCCLLLVPPITMTIIVVLLASFATYAYAIATIAVAILVYRIRLRQGDIKYNVVVETEDLFDNPEVGESELPTIS